MWRKNTKFSRACRIVPFLTVYPSLLFSCLFAAVTLSSAFAQKKIFLFLFAANSLILALSHPKQRFCCFVAKLRCFQLFCIIKSFRLFTANHLILVISHSKQGFSFLVLNYAVFSYFALEKGFCLFAA